MAAKFIKTYKKKKKKSAFNFSIFKERHRIYDGECLVIKDCISIKRLSTALKYYSLLDIISNSKNQKLFADFTKKVYTQLLDDYVHLVNHHADDLNHINKMLKNRKRFGECDVKKCQFTSRHYENGNNNNISLDPTLQFYVETLDSLHFYFFHLYDTGMRTISDENNDTDEVKINDEYFDYRFARISKRVSDRAHITKSFDRFKTTNKKFSISTDKLLELDEDKTNLERIYKYLLQNNINVKYVNQLKQFVDTEEYDTEAIMDDIDCGHVNRTYDTNIFANINNIHCIDVLRHFIRTTKASSISFHIGLRFYYWKYYKNIKTLPANEQKIFNIINHSGHDISELFIKQKYTSFKEEILNYKYITVIQYQEIIITKANNYQMTDIVRGIKATTDACKSLHYDIWETAPLLLAHLISLILYTDFTDLSRDFTSTFRTTSLYEELESIKNRNCKYWWMSKMLREAVEIYGECGKGDWDGINSPRDRNKRINKLTGPFYCGLNVRLNIPEFNISLCSPTSSSLHIEVAVKFSGDMGIIIKLDNPPTVQYDKLRAFNCSWISRYKGEDEQLFFGGCYRIKVKEIILRSTNQNFKTFIHSLYYLDAMITGGTNLGNIKIHKKDVIIIENLINNILHKPTTKRFNDYVYSTFLAFCNNKKEIILDLSKLIKADAKMVNLIMYSLDWNYTSTDYGTLKLRNDNDSTNLFRTELFDVFKNVKTIRIMTTTSKGQKSYTIALLRLLSLIESSSLEKIIIKSVRCSYKEDWGLSRSSSAGMIKREIKYYENWIEILWKSSPETIKKQYGIQITSSKTIKKKYKEKQYSISFKHVQKRLQEYWLVIKRS
eukprot:500911_1